MVMTSHHIGLYALLEVKNQCRQSSLFLVLTTMKGDHKLMQGPSNGTHQYHKHPEKQERYDYHRSSEFKQDGR
jgi:hypothetical protein